MPSPAKKQSVPFLTNMRLQQWLIAVVVALLYGRSIEFGYTTLDDTVLILDNYTFIRDLDNMPGAFKYHVFYNPGNPDVANVYYRPMMTISLMLDAQFGGQSPRFYRFMNLLLHILACLLLLRLLGALRVKPELILLGTLFFTVHPVLAQAVAWIPGRNDSLLAIFIFASFLCFIRFIRTGDRKFLVYHIVLFALGMFTKETGIVMPVICAAWLFLVHRKEKPSASGGLKARSNLLLLAGGYLAALAVWYLLRSNAVENTPADLSLAHLGKSFIRNFPVWFQVVQTAVLPVNLVILSVPADTSYAISLPVMAAVLIAVFTSREKRWGRIAFGFIWFNAFLLPAFIVHILTGFAHRVYVPLFGLLLILSETDILKRISFRNMRHAGLAAAILALLFIAAFRQSDAFRDRSSFWEKAAKSSPHSSLAQLNYGAVLAEKGDLTGAMETYKKGLAINPSEPMTHNNIAILHIRMGQPGLAEKEFLEELRVSPRYSDAYYNLGVLYEKLGREKEMLGMWGKALEYMPGHLRAKNALERYYKRQQDWVRENTE